MDAVVVRQGRLHLWCPGCDDLHSITFGEPGGWTWDGDLERPTINPSILVHYDVTNRPDLSTVCHSFVRAGVWEFLADSTHALAGQKVPMSEVAPRWPWSDEVLSETD